MFDRDATVIRKLRDAGAILLGKLAMVESRAASGTGTRTLRSKAGAKPVEPRSLDGRILQRLRSRGIGRPGGVRDRDRDVGLDPVPIRVLRA